MRHVAGSGVAEGVAFARGGGGWSDAEPATPAVGRGPGVPSGVERGVGAVVITKDGVARPDAVASSEGEADGLVAEGPHAMADVRIAAEVAATLTIELSVTVMGS